MVDQKLADAIAAHLRQSLPPALVDHLFPYTGTIAHAAADAAHEFFAARARDEMVRYREHFGLTVPQEVEDEIRDRFEKCIPEAWKADKE